MQTKIITNCESYNEIKMSMAFNKSTLGMAFINDAFQIISANYSLYKILGVRKKEILFNNITEISQFKDSDLSEQLTNSIKTKQQSIILYIDINKYETPKKLQLYLDLFYDRNRNFSEALIITKDVTKKNKELNKYKEAFTIFESNKEAIIKIDTRGGIVAWNNAAKKTFGYKEKELNGLPIELLLTDEKKTNIIKNSLTHKTITTNGLTKKSKTIDLELTVSCIKENNKIIGKSIICRDITSSVKKRIELNNYINSINKTLSVAIINNKNEILYVNDNYCKLSEMNRNDIIGKNILDAQGYTITDNLNLQREAAMINGVLWSGEVELYNKNNEKYWVFETLIPFIKKGFKTNKYLIIRNNITKTKLGEKAYEGKDILEETIKLKDEFLANISHELRTPLNSVIGFTDLVLETDLTETQKRYLKLIKNSGNLLLILINDIIDLTKIDSGIFNFETLPFNLPNTINEVTDLLTVEARSKNIQFETQIDSKIVSEYIGDPFRLQQIIVNLIKNAIKFTHKGSVSLSVHILEENLISNESIIEFIFKDTGIGIESSKQKVIFNAFTQSEEYITRNYGGFGLGLAIVSKLVKRYKGQIKLESTVNVGTTFSVTIPFLKYNPLNLDQEKGKEPTFEKNKIEKIKEIKILLAEDNENNQILASQRLINWGFKVDIVSNGLEVIEKIKKHDYDLILMDIQMPIMDGYTATIKIRTELPIEKANIPIVALTAHASSSNIKKSKRIGMNDYIYKPFKSDDLYQKIVKQLKINIKDKKQPPTRKRIQRDSKAIIDFNFIFEECLHNNNIILKYLESFIKEFENFIENATLAANLNDTLNIYRATHKILPSIKSLKIKDILQVLEIIYKSSKENKIINYSHLIVEISMLYSDVKEEILSKIETLK